MAVNDEIEMTIKQARERIAGPRGLGRQLLQDSLPCLLKLTLLVYNLFDSLIENSVNSETGRAYTEIIQETDLNGYRSTFSTYDDTYQNPDMYGAPRQIKLGLGGAF